MFNEIAPERARILTLAFPVVFSIMFIAGEEASRAVGYLSLAAGLWAIRDRALAGLVLRAPPFLAVAAYLTFGLISVTWSGRGLGTLAESLGKHINMLLFVFLVAEMVVVAPAVLRKGERYFVATGVLSAAAAIIILAASPESMPGGRLQGLGSIENSVIAAILYGAAALYCVFREWPEARTPLARAAVLAGLAILFAAVLLTQSRGPLLALMATLVFGLFTAGRKGRRLAILSVVASAAIITVTIGWPALLSRGASYRLDIWQQAIDRSAEVVWFGLGMAARVDFVMSDGFQVASAHSIVLSALLTTGLIGLGLLVVMLACLSAQAGRVLRQGDRLPAALLLYVVIYGLVDRQLDLRNLSPEYFTIWYAAGLLVGARVVAALRGAGPGVEKPWPVATCP